MLARAAVETHSTGTGQAPQTQQPHTPCQSGLHECGTISPRGCQAACRRCDLSDPPRRRGRGVFGLGCPLQGSGSSSACFEEGFHHHFRSVCGGACRDLRGSKGFLILSRLGLLDLGLEWRELVTLPIPKGPCTQLVYTQSSPYAGTLGPKYILFEYMDS